MSIQMNERKHQSPEQVVEHERWAAPLVDVYENDDEFLLLVDLPGVVTDRLRVDVDQDELTLEGRRLDSDEDQRWLGYRRSFKLPGGTDYDKVNAELKQGVLWLHLPKAAAIKPRRIQIKAG